MQSKAASYFTGLEQFGQHQYQAAAATLAPLAADPGKTDFWIRSARIYQLKIGFETGHPDQVLTHMQAWCQEDPDLESIPALWVLRGVMARQCQETDMALECFSKALQLKDSPRFYQINPVVALPDITWKPRLGMAEILMQQKQYLNAYHLLKAVLQDLPDHPYVLTLAVKAGFLANQHAELLDWLEQLPELVREDPCLLPALRMTALLLARRFSQVRTEEISALTETLLGQFDNLASQEFPLAVLQEFAIAILHVNAHQPARQLLERLTGRFPLSAILWHNLGYSSFHQQDFDQARRYYEQALQLNPRFVPSCIDLGKLAVMQDQPAEAKRYFLQALASQPEHKLARQALQELAEAAPVAPRYKTIRLGRKKESNDV